MPELGTSIQSFSLKIDCESHFILKICKRNICFRNGLFHVLALSIANIQHSIFKNVLIIVNMGSL